jgi:hypothetical protein
MGDLVGVTFSPSQQPPGRPARSHPAKAHGCPTRRAYRHSRSYPKDPQSRRYTRGQTSGVSAQTLNNPAYAMVVPGHRDRTDALTEDMRRLGELAAQIQKNSPVAEAAADDRNIGRSDRGETTLQAVERKH